MVRRKPRNLLHGWSETGEAALLCISILPLTAIIRGVKNRLNPLRMLFKCLEAKKNTLECAGYARRAANAAQMCNLHAPQTSLMHVLEADDAKPLGKYRTSSV